MKLSKILEKLSRGELSNLAIGSEGAGEIEEKHVGKIVGYVNEAVLRLHSRFLLRKKNLFIELQEHVTNYHLTSTYAQSRQDSRVPYRYIRDSELEPFEGDVIKILEVWNSVGQQMVLNDREYPYSLFTPQPETLEVPYPVNGMALAVTYQAGHSELVPENLEAEVDVPFFLISALTNHVAHQTFEHMNGQEHLGKSQNHLALYEKLCLEVEEKDLVNSSISTTLSKFQKRGFV